MEFQGRRNFLKTAAAGGALALGLPSITSAADVAASPGRISLQNGDIILFQGDSITDAGRNRDEKGFNNTRALGTGYALLASSQLLEEHAGKDLKIANRGISGNKVFQLAERWEQDCLALKPTVLSILIGVNDFSHMLKGSFDGTVETYRKDYTALLERTKQILPDVRLIIGEPFAVAGTSAVNDEWFPRFHEYRAAAREIAGKFNAVFIPYQSIFDKAAKTTPAVYWTRDGIHPSLAGSKLMADAWMKAIS